MKNDGTSIIVTNLSSIIIDNHINNNNNLKNFPITATLRIRRIYTNQYAVKISGGNKNEAEQLAKKYGFINLGPVSCFFFLTFSFLEILMFNYFI